MTSVVSDSMTTWTVELQAPLSMGILQARTLEWVAMPSSRGSSQPKDWTTSLGSSCTAGVLFTAEPLGMPSKRARHLKICFIKEDMTLKNHLKTNPTPLPGASTGVPNPWQGHAGELWWARRVRARGPPHLPGSAWASTPKPKSVCFTILQFSPTPLT